MSEDFVLSGDPGSIAASGRMWGEFSSSASTASTAIRGVQAGAVQGDEWAQFTDDINAQLPGHLDTTSQAWGIVAAALTSYADKLTGFQQRMRSLKTTYDSQQATAANAKANLDAAHRSDNAEKARVSTASAALQPGEKLPASTYLSPTSGAQSSFNEANGNMQATLASAALVRKEHSDALQSAVHDVNRAKGMRFQKPPGWFGSLMHSIGGWISDHADVLAKISSVLKVISAIAGVLSFIPVLAPIMGPIALVTGGAALAIDVTLKLVTGKGSWLSIGIDAATMLLPGVGKLLGKGVKTAVGTEKFAAAGGRMTSAIGDAKAMAALRNSPTLGKLTSGVSKANSAFEKFALRVPGVRAANIRAGRLVGNISPRFSNIDDALAHARPHLQGRADEAWASATTRSDPAYFRHPNAEGPKTRWDDFAASHGRDPSLANQGTWAHTTLEQSLKNHGDEILPSDSGYRIRTEVSYRPDGSQTRQFGADTKRPDILIEQGHPGGDWKPAAVVDLKTGKAGISHAWRTAVSERTGIHSSLITELRPGAGPIAGVPSGAVSSSSSGGTAFWVTPALPMPSLFMNGS
ncbi:MAG: hypothetical protein M3Z00_05620 [Actinomycetota bacterium]|nr:hypothetical protein [Actinomycetota bacterium]